MQSTVSSIEDPGKLADTIAAHLSLKLNDKQGLLETEDVVVRLEKLFELMQAEIEILQVEKKIRSRVKKQMEKNQKGVLSQRANAGHSERTWRARRVQE